MTFAACTHMTMDAALRRISQQVQHPDRGMLRLSQSVQACTVAYSRLNRRRGSEAGA